MQCQICGKKSHPTNKCFLLHNILTRKSLKALCSGDSTYALHASVGSKNQIKPIWLLDLGATNHWNNDSATLDHSESYSGSNSIIVGNGQPLSITHIGHSLYVY